MTRSNPAGEDACEGHGLEPGECLAVGCCAYNDGDVEEPCHSKVGETPCYPPGPPGPPGHSGLLSAEFEHLYDAWGGALQLIESDVLQGALAKIVSAVTHEGFKPLAFSRVQRWTLCGACTPHPWNGSHPSL